MNPHLELNEATVRKWLEENPAAATRIVGDIIKPDHRQSVASRFFEIATTVYSSLDVNTIVSRALTAAADLVNAERCSLFLVDKEAGELYSSVWDVGNRGAGIDLTQSDDGQFRIKIGSGIAGWVAQTGQSVNVEDAYGDPRFDTDADMKTGLRTKTMLCMPIFVKGEEGAAKSGQSSNISHLDASSGSTAPPYSGPLGVLGVATLINKKRQPGNKTPCFSAEDEATFRDFLVLVGIALHNSLLFKQAQQSERDAVKLAERNAELYARASRDVEKSKALLELAESLFGEDNVQELGRKIIENARNMTRADKASLFLLDAGKNELYSAVFDTVTKRRLTFPLGRGIAGYVAQTGEIVNLDDAYTDSRFNKDVDVETGYRTRSILCVPVLGPSNKVVGVATLINKLTPDGTGGVLQFDGEDVAIFRAFSIVCGLALHKTLLLEEIRNHQQMLAVTMELMSYHATAQPEDVVVFFRSAPEEVVAVSALRSIDFDPHDYGPNDDRLVVVVNQMFLDLDYSARFRVPVEKWIRYVLTVKRNYRPVAYHNFTHAVSVAHTVYLLITLGALEGILDEIEQFSMFVAALNHDIDHRGTNNQFQKTAHTALASFYSTSTMERHHFNHAMTIISTPDHNILDNLSGEEYRRCLKYFEHAILATDLALHFGNKGKVAKLVEEKSFDKGNPAHRDLLRGLVMTCSDLSSMTKPWERAQRTADHVYEEFFLQGDQERLLGLPYSAELMDRSRTKEIPRMQCEFLSHVVRPAFELLHGLLGDVVEPFVRGVEEGIKGWGELRDSGVEYELHGGKGSAAH
ncbi:cGMP-specific 3',5'-cyclic phosphodiesterase [Borealophlyctis nickersoniae]|nr:cGMP-specific 3',5'-cyclic phosphodiesterase [Borealophlyctis nickersoniae]